MPPTRETSNVQQYGNPFQVLTMAENRLRALDTAVEFVVQPVKEYRFRYKSEFKNGSHGCLKGELKKKCFPTVRLKSQSRHEKEVTFRCSLVTANYFVRHCHKVVESKYTKDCSDSEPEYVEFNGSPQSDGSWRCELKGLNILQSPKDAFHQWYDKEYVPNAGEIPTVEESVKQLRRELDNTVCLFVEAFSRQRCIGRGISNPISHTKKNIKLNIAEISQPSGEQKGSQEIIILCSELSKDVIKKPDYNKSDVCVEFFEIAPDGKELWSSMASIKLIHYQSALKICTPEYSRTVPEDGKEVFMRLRLRSTNDVSEPRKFMYTPNEDERVRRKRAKIQKLRGEQGAFQERSAQAMPSSGPGTASVGQFPEPSMASPSLGFPGDNMAAFGEIEMQEDIPDVQQLHNYVMRGDGQDIDEFVNVLEPTNDFLDMFINRDIDPVLGQGMISGDECLPVAGNLVGPHVEDLQLQGPNPYYAPGSDLFDDFEKGQIQLDGIKNGDGSDYGKVAPGVVPGSNGDRQSTSEAEMDTLIAYKLALHTARCLHNYARTGNVHVLLMSMRHLVALQDEQGDNAIHTSVIHTQGDALRNLVEVARTVPNYDILNMVNELKQAPLHIAVQTEQVRAIQVLLYHGSNPNLKDRNGNTPIHVAAQMNAVDCLNALLDTKSYTTKYKSNAPNLDSVNFAGYSALHLAVLKDSFAAIERLCYAGCDVNQQDRTTGRTALHMAVEKNDTRLIEFLLNKALADTDIQMFNGNTPLHLACLQGQEEVVSLLMDAKADPYMENYEIAKNEDEDGSEASLQDGDVDVRGLTSIDLASTEKIRCLLRREPISIVSSLSSMTDVEEQEEAAAIEVPVRVADNKSESKNNIMDSGIGLSGMGLSSAMSVDSSMGIDTRHDKAKNVSLGELLDSSVKDQLARLLDPAPGKWRNVIDFLNLSQIEEKLAMQKSPTTVMLNYIRDKDIQMFENTLEALAYHEPRQVLKSALSALDSSTTRLEESGYLESRFRDLEL